MLPYPHIVSIDKNSKAPVYEQIATGLVHAIRNGILKPGARLPGSRELAKHLGVHRKTVIAAYDELNAQDWIVVVPRKHVSVSESIPVLRARKWQSGPARTAYEHEMRVPFHITGQAPLPENGQRAMGPVLDDGHPDIRLSPIDELMKAYRSLASHKRPSQNALGNAPQGTLFLRDQVARYLSESRGLNITAEHVIITHGAQMSIYLSSRLLLGPGTSAIVGRPNYTMANKALAETGAELIEVPVDEEGIDTEAIERVCKKKRIKAVYVIPHHHYPTTVTLSVERRMRLLELSDRFSFAIIEDDYDYDYHYDSSPYLPLASANHQGQVIYIGSFSKLLDPSIRIGFMVAPKNFIAQCTAFRAMIDVGGDGHMQNALATLIKEGTLKRHLKKAKKCYHGRRDYLDSLLKERLAPYVHYVLPSGGMAIWLSLKPPFDVRELVSGTAFHISGIDAERNAFRFGFASMQEREIEHAVSLIEKRLQKMGGRA